MTQIDWDKVRCPFCNRGFLHDIASTIECQGCCRQADEGVWQELIRTRKELEQSEICCTEWEKQALDYKAENIALSGELERTRKALEFAWDALIYDGTPASKKALDKIKALTALEQKEVKMITDKDRVIKVSFYYQPTDDIFDADDMRNALYNFLDSFKMYDLQVKDTTIAQEQKD